MERPLVEIVEIADVLEHPNADRLEIAVIKGWQCVIAKSSFKKGDKAVYFPIDSVLPPDVEVKLFPPESKVKLSNSRIRTIKLRGAISQGLLARPELFDLHTQDVGTNVAVYLNIQKYEPSIKAQSSLMGGSKGVAKKAENPYFQKYTKIQNFKNYNSVFTERDLVIVTEKIHGTNFRAGWVPKTTLLAKIRKFLRLGTSYEFVFGSHNIQLQQKASGFKTFYDANVYAEAVKKYDLKNRIPKSMVIYGEIYGSGIQKNYTYECKQDERKLVIFDIQTFGKYTNSSVCKWYCKNVLDLTHVPILYQGAFDLEKIKKLTKGNSVLAPTQKIREGVVIKAVNESNDVLIGRKVLKLVSDEYLLKKNNSDLH